MAAYHPCTPPLPRITSPASSVRPTSIAATSAPSAPRAHTATPSPTPPRPSRGTRRRITSAQGPGPRLPLQLPPAHAAPLTPAWRRARGTRGPAAWSSSGGSSAASRSASPLRPRAASACAALGGHGLHRLSPSGYTPLSHGLHPLKPSGYTPLGWRCEIATRSPRDALCRAVQPSSPSHPPPPPPPPTRAGTARWRRS